MEVRKYGTIKAVILLSRWLLGSSDSALQQFRVYAGCDCRDSQSFVIFHKIIPALDSRSMPIEIFDTES